MRSESGQRYHLNAPLAGYVFKGPVNAAKEDKTGADDAMTWAWSKHEVKNDSNIEHVPSSTTPSVCRLVDPRVEPLDERGKI
jgi:hypothetical protein